MRKSASSSGTVSKTTCFHASQEDVFDVIFYGVLTILVMDLLGLNPWPLLVSFSTVMVSFAFSFGPSCARYIEVGYPLLAIWSRNDTARALSFSLRFYSGNLNDRCETTIQ